MKSISENISLSVLDLFSVLLPGFVAELLLWQLPVVNQTMVDLFSFLQQDWQSAIAFFIGAYIIGHILFFLGSFLDTLLYDNLKDRIWDNKFLLQQVTAIKKKLIGFDDASLLNTYKWSKAVFLLKHPSIYTLIESIEASSKFFRSLSLVMLLGAAIFFSLAIYPFSFFCFVFMFLALTMYFKLRHKAIRTTYEHMLAVNGTLLNFSNNNGNLEELNRQVTIAEAKQKIKFFKTMLADDVIFSDSENGVVSKSSFIKHLKSLKYKKLETRYVSMKYDDSESAAVITCHQFAEGEIKGDLFKTNFKTIRFYRRQGTQWRIHAWYRERLN